MKLYLSASCCAWYIDVINAAIMNPLNSFAHFLRIFPDCPRLKHPVSSHALTNFWRKQQTRLYFMGSRFLVEQKVVSLIPIYYIVNKFCLAILKLHSQS